MAPARAAANYDCTRGGRDARLIGPDAAGNAGVSRTGCARGQQGSRASIGSDSKGRGAHYTVWSFFVVVVVAVAVLELTLSAPGRGRCR